MTAARFRRLTLDALEPERLGAFWSAVLGRPYEDLRLVGETPQHELDLVPVEEPKAVKHRVHLDVFARSLADLTALGAQVLQPEGEDRTWTVLADPEGGEFCAFLRDELPADRLYSVVVDCADPRALATWWGEVYGAPVRHEPDVCSTVYDVPGMPMGTFVFLPVPEPKAGRNRVRWEVRGDVAELVGRGAVVVADGMLADPEGNEFVVVG